MADPSGIGTVGAENGRDSGGRFVKGWKGGPGRGPGTTAAGRRAAFVASITPESLEKIAKAMVAAALDGDVAAAKVVLSYVIGPPETGESTEASAISVPTYLTEPRGE